jgi:hypothetical protein
MAQGCLRFERRWLRRARSAALGGTGRCRRDGGAGSARRGSGSCSRSLGRHVQCAQLCGRVRGGVHLDGGHCGVVERRCGREEKAGALNRAGLDRW